MGAVPFGGNSRFDSLTGSIEGGKYDTLYSMDKDEKTRGISVHAS